MRSKRKVNHQRQFFFVHGMLGNDTHYLRACMVLDTGAEMTMIPREVVRLLQLKTVRRSRASTAAGQKVFLDEVKVYIDVPGRGAMPTVAWVARGNEQTIWLGADVIRRLKLLVPPKGARWAWTRHPWKRSTGHSVIRFQKRRSRI